MSSDTQYTYDQNNLFYYATSELSQDAFICYLLSFAERPYVNRDPAITKCARAFIRACFAPNTSKDNPFPGITLPEPVFVDEICKQWENIDVLVRIGEYYIIIEDKTFTGIHDDQLDRYTNTLHEKKGVPVKNIVRIYFKSSDQAEAEKTAHHSFFPKQILELFRPYIYHTTNRIFLDYVQKLEEDMELADQYQNLPIQSWSSSQFNRFYEHMIQNGIIQNGYWEYVNNAAGGFAGCWWSPLSTLNKYKDISQFEPYLDGLYLQIEGSSEEAIIALKYSLKEEKYASDNKGGYDMNAVRDIRWGLHDRMVKIIGDLDNTVSFQKKTFRPGCYMTVGYIALDDSEEGKTRYNEKNCVRRIQLMERALLQLAEELSRAEYDAAAREIVWDKRKQ